MLHAPHRGNHNEEWLERHKLRSARLLEPLQQGDELSLCGLYAIMNALRLACEPIRPLSRADVRQLFEAGIDFLEAEEALSAAIFTGIDAGLWRRLGKHLHWAAGEATGLLVTQHRPFERRARVSRIDLIAEVQRCLLREQPVMCELGGAYDHYTVICGYSPTNLLLFDSYGFARVAIAACGIQRAASSHRHQLDPKTLLVSSIEARR